MLIPLYIIDLICIWLVSLSCTCILSTVLSTVYYTVVSCVALSFYQLSSVCIILIEYTFRYMKRFCRYCPRMKRYSIQKFWCIAAFFLRSLHRVQAKPLRYAIKRGFFRHSIKKKAEAILGLRKSFPSPSWKKRWGGGDIFSMKMRPHRYLVSEIGSEQGQEGCIPFHIHILVRTWYTKVGVVERYRRYVQVPE